MIGSRPHRQPPGMTPNEAAAYWLVQRDAGRLHGRSAEAFDAWRTASPSHAEAFERACETWGLFDDTNGEPHIEALREAALGAKPERRNWLWAGAGTAIAASLMMMALWPGGLLSGVQRSLASDGQRNAHDGQTAGKEFESADFTTAKGEQRRIELADGSRIILNTDSALRVAYAADRRLITLIRGQALFEVAKNRGWPFVVEAGGRRITALGTMFDVRVDRDRMQVTLAEGKVVIDGRDDHAEGGRQIIPTLLTPGHELVTAQGLPQIESEVDVEQRLRWRDGFVEFGETPLASAAEEMNRYSSRRLVVEAAVADIPVSGIFRTGSPQRFAAILTELLPVRAHELPDGSIEILAETTPQR